MIDISLPKDLKPDPAKIGNSGMIFDSLDEASNWYGMRFGDGEVANKDGIPIGKWTVDFHEAGSFFVR
ncbi:hypothetical protein [Enterococcus faecalis]|uniref:hypothetical protein n=1 Tax=Enterococcus faecalis TaxID=1351 RepID=UPI0034CEDBA5